MYYFQAHLGKESQLKFQDLPVGRLKIACSPAQGQQLRLTVLDGPWLPPDLQEFPQMAAERPLLFRVASVECPERT